MEKSSRERPEFKESGLRVRGLARRYGDIVALDGVDLDVGEGIYGLLGPNGAGKTTLMRTLATLQTPDAGSIRLDDIDVLAEPDRLRRRLGYLPQQIGAYPGVAGRELLHRFAWLKGRTDRAERTREVDELLERINLAEDADRHVVTYSGGMLRRFGIGLALLGAPRLLIVDEPTAGLDPAERNRFHRILADIASDAVVLLSTHIVEDIENLCTRLSILDRGRIVEGGPTDELLAPLRGRLWESEVARGEAVPEDALHVTASPQGSRVVVASAVEVPGYRPREPRLEDVYHHALRAHGQPVEAAA